MRQMPTTEAIAPVLAGAEMRVVIVNDRYAANSSSSAFASFRSLVSNPSVNHP